MTHDAPAITALAYVLLLQDGALQSRVGDRTWVTRRLERREQTSARAAALANKGTV